MVAKKGCKVTSEVVPKIYGDSAGKVVADTGAVLGNSLRALHIITMVAGTQTSTTMVLRHTGKQYLKIVSPTNAGGDGADARQWEAKFSFSSESLAE